MWFIMNDDNRLFFWLFKPGKVLDLPADIKNDRWGGFGEHFLAVLVMRSHLSRVHALVDHVLGGTVCVLLGSLLLLLFGPVSFRSCLLLRRQPAVVKGCFDVRNRGVIQLESSRVVAAVHHNDPWLKQRRGFVGLWVFLNWSVVLYAVGILNLLRDNWGFGRRLKILWLMVLLKLFLRVNFRLDLLVIEGLLSWS